MTDTYAALRSYADEGVVLVDEGSGDPPSETIFSTRFARPDRFKFSWTSHHPYLPLRHIKWHSAIWANVSGVFMWHNYGEEKALREPVESLEMAIASATGVSTGSALTVSALLVPEINSRSLRDLRDAELHPIEDFAGENCYRVHANMNGFGPCNLWISCADFLLRRLSYILLDSRVDEIRRNVQFNTELPDHEFDFAQ